VAGVVPGVLPTFLGTVKPGAGDENGNKHSGSSQSSTVTGLLLWFSNVIVVPCTPCHPLLQTFFSSLIGLPFDLRYLDKAEQNDGSPVNLPQIYDKHPVENDKNSLFLVLPLAHDFLIARIVH